MDKKENKMIAVAYKLYTTADGTTEMVEEATAERPFQFISGFGIALEKFEEEVAKLSTGDEFDFTLTKENAYGDYEEAHVVDLDKEIFTINGHFDHDNIFVDAIVPLQNEDGNRFMGRVLEIADDKVKMDLNHPLAGKDLNFKGHVVEARTATDDEIKALIDHMNGHGCGCGCEDCGEGCDSHHDHGDHCGCGHCH